MRLFSILSCLMATLFLAATLPQNAARAETFVGTNVDSRVLVGFKADAASVQAFLPEGWTQIAFPAGPLKGANFLVVLIDRALQLDPDGKPTEPANMRAAALAGLARQDGGDAVRLYLYRIYTTTPETDPYGNAMSADIAHSSATEGPANAGRARTENWTIAPQDGGQIDMALSFTSGRRNWGADTASPYSNTNPEFSRIYRYDQLVDLVTSSAVGKPLAGEFSFSSTVPELSGVFDGSEEMIAILDVPVYVREVYLP